MKTAVIAAVVLALATLCSPAHAWNCTQPGQIRVQVPAGTVGNGQGDGPGQVDTVEGITFQCQTPPAPPTTTNPSSNTNTNSSNSTSSANSNSTSASNSTSKSNSNSTSNATGGNASSVATGGNQKQNQNQTQVATGGNATGGNASAQGGTSSANGNGVGNGNGSNNASYSSNSVTNVAASKIPVASAIAPPVLPANPCFKGFGAAVQTMVVGGSFGGGKIDGNCAILETARLAPSLLAKCKVYITDKYAKAAGVTLEDCMIQEEAAVPAPVQVESAAPVQVQPVVVNVQPAAPVVVPAPAVNVIVPAAPAPSVVVRSSKPHVPQSSKKCVQKTCPTEKPTVFTNDGHGNVVKEYQN